jgi:hypothetical protein
MVMHKGDIVLFDEELYPQLKGMNSDAYCKISINDSNKYVKGDLPLLINKIKQFYPEARFPINY